MPYCGRPSTGCETCRSRKIKCDRAESACENCSKAGWACPGYRNPIDVLFHDESAKVVRKAKAAKQRSTGVKIRWDGAEKSPKDSEPNGQFNELGQRVTSCRVYPIQHSLDLKSPEAVLFSTLDELATGFFFHYYVFADKDEYDMRKALESSSCLKAAIVALGAAAVTRSGPGLSCPKETRSRYTRAIHLTSEALASPSDVEKDSTLLAVNILGVFEVKTGLQNTLDSWHKHVHGATALLQYRATKQFETAEGGRLFMQTVTSLVMSCLARRLPIPSYVHSLTAEAEKQVPNPHDWDWRCFRLNLHFADLYTRLLPNNIPSSPTEAPLVIHEALDLDRDMRELLDDSPDDWQFKIINADIPKVCPGNIYAFPHYFAAQQYISLLYKRIILQDVMLKVLWFHPDLSSLHLSVPELQYIRSASATIRKLQLDILACMPQHLGICLSQEDFITPFSANWPEHLPKDTMWPNFTIKDLSPWRSRQKQFRVPSVRSCCGYTIQWPLYITGAADAVNGEIRMLVIGYLRLLGQNMGLQQAFLLADSLEACKGEQLNAHIDFTKEIIG